MATQTTQFRLPVSVIGAFAGCGAMLLVLIMVGQGDHPALHTVLDTSLALLSGILALLLMDMARYVGRALPRHLAVGFGVTFFLTLVHVLTGMEWTGFMAPIAQASGDLRPGSWPASVYILPMGILCSLWLMRRGVEATLGFAAALLGLGCMLVPLFIALPRYTPPGALGITRPALVLSPVLWLAVGWYCWKWRAAERKLPMLAVMAVPMFLSTVTMLYSQSPHDSTAIAVHLLALCGYLVPLLLLMRTAAGDMRARIRAEAELAQFNQHLEWRIQERTKQVEAVNQSLLSEMEIRRQAEQARHASETRYQSLFEYAPDGIVIADSKSYYLDANASMCRMLGYERDEFIGLHARDIVAPSEVEHIKRALKTIRVEDNYYREWIFKRKDGSLFPAEVIARAMPDGNLMAMIRDITQRKQAEARIAYLNRVYAVLSGINNLIVRVDKPADLFQESCRIAVEAGGFRMAWIGIVDAASEKIVISGSAGMDAGLLGGVAGALAKEGSLPYGDTMPAQVVRDRKERVLNDLRGDPPLGHGKLHAAAGALSMASLPLIVGENVTGVLTLCASEPEFFHKEEMTLLSELAGDIAFALDHIEKQQRIDYLSLYDALTGLPNRGLFQHRLAHSLHTRAGEQPLIAVALLDIERFRRVNDTLGRMAGDDLLRQVGRRLARANDTSARIGIDMFGLVFRGGHNGAEVNRAIDAIIRACFSEPFELEGHEIRLACRAGVALYPGDADDADGLLRNAEIALKRSKGGDERVIFYAPEMNARVAESLAFETSLRRAVECEEFVLHYQPKVSLDTGDLVGAEALIRWIHKGKLIPPVEFIPVLEETGMILDVGRWVIKRALRDVRGWAAGGLVVPRIAVNVSAMQLRARDFVSGTMAEVIRNGGETNWLELEITESLMMRDVEDTISKLASLRGQGFTIAIDDFGTGYSSLSYLSQLPLDSLKIDRSFVSRITQSGEAASIVSTIVALGQSLKLKVVAEGVETEEESAFLKLLGCDQAQGYLYSKPIPGDQFAARFLRTSLAKAM